MDASARTATAVDLPGGWLTFLITDIVGSAGLVRADSKGFGSALAEYRRRMRRTVAHASGVEVSVEADNCLFVFEDPSAALDGCVAAQRELSNWRWPAHLLRLHVRMGVHTGFAHPVNDEYVSVEVYHAARVAAAAHGGQVLCSAATAERARLRPERVWLIDLGCYRLPDFPSDERLFQLAAPGLRRRFPGPPCDRSAGGLHRGARMLPPVRPALDALTHTESVVAHLVAQGLSNPQIAQRLYISRFTVETHLKHIFAKLAISARTELAVLIARADRPTNGGT